MKKVILLIVSALFGLMFINSGLNKFLQYMPMPESMPEAMMKASAAMMEINWLMPLVGVAEILGGILFLFTRTRALGAVVIFPVMIGIVLTHLFISAMGLPIALVLFAVNLWVTYENRSRYLPMVQ